MSRALKRNIAKHIKEEQKDNYPSLKKVSISKFMKSVNTNIPEEELPVDGINKFALLIKTLQFCILVRDKNIKESSFTILVDKFIDAFSGIKKGSRYLIYKDTLMLAEKRLDVILKSINEDFDTKAFSELDVPNIINEKIDNSFIPFLVKSMQVFVGWYREKDETFRGFTANLKSSEAKDFQGELEEYTFNLDRNALVRSDNLIERLLNLKHSYTTQTVRKISLEIEEEVNDLLRNYIHKDKEDMIIKNASNHFYKLLEIRITFSAIYDIVLSRNDLKLLLRACYYYAISKINNFLETPDDLKDLIEVLKVHSNLSIMKLRVGAKYIDNNEHFKTLLLTSRIEIPTVAYVLDSAAESIIDKNNKIDIEEFKDKLWLSVKSLLEFLNSKQCNKLYKSTYAIDIQGCNDTFFNLINGEHKNNKEWFYKLLKKYDIFKMNKNYIAI